MIINSTQLLNNSSLWFSVLPLRISVLLFFFSPAAFSQENISLHAYPSPGNSMHYEDLWNLTINSSPVNFSAYYFLEIEVEEMPGNSLWKAKTYSFKINSSPFIILPTNLSFFEPVTIYYAEPGWHEKMSRGGGLFPPGDYKITYRLIETTEGCTTVGRLLATTNIIKTITSLFPPSLLFPFNSDTLDTETPVFSWLPVLPVQKSGINYSLKISEITGNQTAEQALTNNRPFLYFDAGEALFTVYPAGNMPLRKGAHYSWQVVAKTTQGMLAYSEVWRFTIREAEKADTVSSLHVFLSLKGDLSGPVYIVKGNYLFLRYNGVYSDADGKLEYVLSTTDHHEILLTGKIRPLAEQQGFNTYAIHIASLPEGNYQVTVKDEKGNKGYMVFKRMNE